MSTVRLTFLYPHLFRSIKTAEPGVQTARQCRQHPRANLTTSPRKSQFVQRHGKAVEHVPQAGDNKSEANPSLPEIGSLKFQKQEAAEQAKEGKQDKDETKPPPPDLSSSAPLSEETQAAAHIPSDVGVYSTISSSGSSLPQSDNATPANSQNAGAKSFEGELPVDTILHMDPPSTTSPSGEPLPHLIPPPYVHHFDSYTLVKQVESGGFTSPQAVTAMKVVRALLAENLDVAKEGLVSKSDVENETYLFQAACSELRTEIQNARRAQDEKMRAQRTLLQHEVEILNQKLTQELLALKDELRGMFNDRKMDVRMDQRSMESAIQQLNYKITVALNSDSKSEVEALRWILTRRSVIAIVFMAVLVLASLRYASYRSHEEEMTKKKAEMLKEQEKQDQLHHRDFGDGVVMKDLTPAGVEVGGLSAN